MSWGYVAVAGATVGSTLINKYGGKNKVEDPKEVRQARTLLTDFASNGKFGNFTAGQDLGLGIGDFQPTDIEQSGLSSLQRLLAGGIPEQFDMGDAALRDMLATDPSAISAQFDPFKKQVEKDTVEQEQAQKRSAAFGGNLYSTDTIKNLGGVRSNANDTLASKLAELTNQFMDRRLQAIPLAYQSGEARQNVALNQVAASQQYGGLTRQLNDTAIKSRDAEILRRRQELQLPINAAGTVLGSPAQMPIESSPYAALLGTVGNIAGSYLGNKAYADQYKRFYPSGTGGPAPTTQAPAASQAGGGPMSFMGMA